MTAILPEYTRGVTREADEFRFVEVLRHFTRAYGVHGAYEYEQRIVGEREEKRVSIRMALENNQTLVGDHVDVGPFVGEPR